MIGLGRTPRRVLAGGLAALLASVFALAPAFADENKDNNGQVPVTVRIPDGSSTPSGARTVTDAVLAWAINPESGSGAFYGECNFLSAGKAGNAGGAKVWATGNAQYHSSQGAVTVQKPVLSGGTTTWQEATWATRCLDQSDGASRKVTTSATDYGTGNRVSITGGTGTVNTSTGEATIRWKGSFTVVFYGGLTYWWVTDPVLTVKGGKGTLTATAGGYGASMDDLSQWVPLAERTITLGTLSTVSLSSDRGFTATPAYRSVSVTTAGGQEQTKTGSDWGSFPQDFVTFQAATGQSGYWYSTGGVRDFAKPPYPVTVSYSAADRVDDGALPQTSRGGGTSTAGSGAAAVATPAPASSSGQAAAALVPSATPGAAPVAASDAYPATVPEVQQAARQLIPAAVAATEDPRARFIIAFSAMAILAMACYVGFRRGWLTLPWKKG